MKLNKKKKSEVITPIDIHSDVAKDEAGLLWYKPGFVRDESVWTKTKKEKDALKKAKRRKYPPFFSSWGYTKDPIPFYGKLIIQLYQTKNPSFTTLSIQCGQSEIPQILDRHDSITIEGKTVCGNIRRYKWNGRWYKRNELPVW